MKIKYEVLFINFSSSGGSSMQWGKILNYFTLEELNYLKSLPEYIKAESIISRIYVEKLDENREIIKPAKLDLSGNPEVLHFLYVSNHATTEEGRIVGLLHDVVEDGHIDFGDLLLRGFSSYIVSTLQILCRDKSKYPKYEDYITSIIESGNRVALETKFYDIRHNLSPIRILSLPEERQEKACKKYCEALPRIAIAYERSIVYEEYTKRRKIV